MIEVDHLEKRFGGLIAVKDISFQVVPGEILGFLGPNGAGKSTTMKMVTGFIRPTAGSIKVWGHDVVSDTLDAQKRIGYLPEGAPCYEEMTPASFLHFIGEVRGFSGHELETRVADAAAKMSLESVLHQRIETLSKGFKRRVGLAQAILHDPDVLVLDEPTDGLDPNQKHQVRELIRGLSRDKIVIISTHILEEVTAVCTRAIIIAEGSIVADCEPAELERQSRYHQAITIRVKDVASAASAALRFEELSVVAATEVNDSEIVIFPAQADGGLLPAVIDLVAAEGLQLDGLFQERGRLDEVFRRITGELHAGS